MQCLLLVRVTRVAQVVIMLVGFILVFYLLTKTNVTRHIKSCGADCIKPV